MSSSDFIPSPTPDIGFMPPSPSKTWHDDLQNETEIDESDHLKLDNAEDDITSDDGM